MIFGLHNAQITIPKGAEKEGKQFYCNVLGLEEIESRNYSKIGDRDVHVGTEDELRQTINKGSFSLFGKRYFTQEKCIQAKSIQPIEGDAIPGFDRFEFRDPFGNRVEMIQEI